MAERKGYARPSPFEVGVEAQIAAMKKAGAETVFVEKTLSKEADRPELRRALDGLVPGDVLLVASLDRLARTTTELFYILEEIIRRGSSLLSLKESLLVGADGPTDAAAASTGAPGPAGTQDEAPENDTGSFFMRDLGLVIGFERASLREWQRESIGEAKARRKNGASGDRKRR